MIIGEESGISIGLAIFIFMGLASLWWRIESRSNGIDKELQAYKLYVAQNHVSMSSLKETEERLINAVDKLTARIEAVVSRLDKMAMNLPSRE